MKPKFLGILIAAALIVALLAFLTAKSAPSATTTAADSAELIPGFAVKINSVARIELRKGKDTIVAVHQADDKNGTWILENRSNFPAKFEKVKELLISFNDTKLVEKKTDQPDRFGALEIDDPSDTAKSTLITLTDDKKQPIASFIVGKMALGPGGRSGDGFFIRKAGDKTDMQVWQSTLKQAPDLTFNQWIDPVVLQLERTRIRSASISPASGDKISIYKATQHDPNFILENKPANKEFKFPGAGDTPAYAIEFLDMADVAPSASIDFAKEPIATATYTTFDGLVTTATLAKSGDKSWIKLSFATDFTNAFVDEPVKDDTKKDEPKKDDPNAPKPLKSHDDVTKEAADLNLRHANWAYQIVDYKVNQFVPKLSDMLKDPEPPPSTTPTTGASPPLLQNPSPPPPK